ncbi:MAG: MBG domain-containing protein, partial [Lentisphaerota bacterium]
SGGVLVHGFARWTGANWSNLGLGIYNGYELMTVAKGPDDALYTGGVFYYIDNLTTPGIAKWNGMSWTNLADGLFGHVYALAFGDDGCLYAGGWFTNSGASAANCVAKWNGTSWTNLESGLNYFVYALAQGKHGELYAGGNFSVAGSVATRGVAKWAHVETDFGVSPFEGSWTGAYEVVISGSNLCNGADVTSVTLCGIAATVHSQSATQIVVKAGTADSSHVGLGDVQVHSVSFGTTVRSNAFTYLAPGLQVLGTNGVLIASSEAASTAKGTDFGNVLVLGSYTNWLTITNNGTETMTISEIATNGTGSAYFSALDVPASLPAGGSASFAVVYAATTVGVHNAAIQLENDSPTALFQINLAGNAVKRDQAITFPAILDQLTTNSVLLSPTAGSGLPVELNVLTGSGSLAPVTNGYQLTFTGDGEVLIHAIQLGDYFWNAAASLTNAVNVTKAVAPVTLNSLDQMYDGTPRVVTATTAPTGMTVVITYDGSLTAPTEAGSYAVTGRVNNVMYQGGQTGVLTIGKATAGVGFLNVTQTYDGTARAVTATTMPAGLTVQLTYDGRAWAPTNAGTYAVTGTVSEANYQGALTGSLTIEKSSQTIAFEAIGDQYITNRPGLSASASSGLNVGFAVGSGPAVVTEGTNLGFTATGMVSMVASQAGDGNYLEASNVVRTFQVIPLRPLIVGPFVTNALATTAGMGGEVVELYGAQVLERGAFWNTHSGFALADGQKSGTAGVFGLGAFTQQVAGLVSGITNYFRAFAATSGGTGVTDEAWVQLLPEAPGIALADDVQPNRFRANWQIARGATNYCLDVSEDEGFGGFVPGFDNLRAGPVLQQSVTGLTAGITYFYRLRAENQAGLSSNSLVMSAVTAPRLTILTWPRDAGQTIPEQGSHIVKFGAPTQVVTWANAGYQFGYWEGAGSILVDDSYARTTTVTLLMNSVLTAYYQQQVSAITWTYTRWRTNYVQGTIVGTAEACNTATNGARLMGPFWYCVRSNASQRLRYPTGMDLASGWPYLDVTAQMEAGAGDGILDPGECATVTNIVFYTSNFKPPSNLIWQLRAVAAPAEDRVDTDGDIMPDEWEAGYPGVLDPLNPTDGSLDHDGDGQLNEEEWISNTDPTDPFSFFALEELLHPSGIGNLLTWPSATGRVYNLYWTTNALLGYQLIREGIGATPPGNTVTDVVYGVDAQGFYRIDVRNP